MLAVAKDDAVAGEFDDAVDGEFDIV